jgi:hypothetical protein
MMKEELDKVRVLLQGSVITLSDDDMAITAARYALLPAVKVFFDRQGCAADQVALLITAFEQAVTFEVEKRSVREAA